MPTAHPALELLTAEDYRATPEGTRCQLVEGELIMSPAPNRFHQDIVLNLIDLLRGYLRAHPIGRVYAAPFDVFISEHNVFQPDLLFVASANYAKFTDDGLHGAPDLAIEVLSPGTAHLDKKNKRKVYVQAGVRELWLVDPLLLQVQIYDFTRDPAKPIRFVEEDETFSTALLPGLTIHAAEVFKR
jgi:Uma2 family endonuclease